MERIIERAYKRDCFQGRGIVGRWTDWLFFSCLGGLLLFIAFRILWLSAVFTACLLLVQLAWASHRWTVYYQTLKNDICASLRRENWLTEEAARIRADSEVVLFPLPGRDRLIESCLNAPKGTRFHCFGTADASLCKVAEDYGCTLVFHPWGMGKKPTEEAVEKRIVDGSNVRKGGRIGKLFSQTDIRYFITGGALLLLSLFMNHAIYWRLTASVCFFFGTIKRVALLR